MRQEKAGTRRWVPARRFACRRSGGVGDFDLVGKELLQDAQAPLDGGREAAALVHELKSTRRCARLNLNTWSNGAYGVVLHVCGDHVVLAKGGVNHKAQFI